MSYASCFITLAQYRVGALESFESFFSLALIKIQSCAYCKTLSLYILQRFGQPHDVTVSRDGKDIYVGDIGQGQKVWKLDRPALTSPPPNVNIGDIGLM